MQSLRMSRAVLGAILAVLTSGCYTTFNETHHFGSVSKKDGSETPINYYRLTINGYAAFTSARYTSGYYDERAVDLFFNEIKKGKSDGQVPALFDADAVNPGTDEKLVPLSPDVDNGALVMILSTNATSVANTIGNFAQGEVAAAAITNLVNRDAIRKARRRDAAQDTRSDQAVAIEAELKSLVGSIDDSSVANMQDSAKRLLNTIAASVEPGVVFDSYDDAKQWFESYDW